MALGCLLISLGRSTFHTRSHFQQNRQDPHGILLLHCQVTKPDSLLCHGMHQVTVRSFPSHPGWLPCSSSGPRGPSHKQLPYPSPSPRLSPATGLYGVLATGFYPELGGQEVLSFWPCLLSSPPVPSGTESMEVLGRHPHNSWVSGSPAFWVPELLLAGDPICPAAISHFRLHPIQAWGQEGCSIPLRYAGSIRLCHGCLCREPGVAPGQPVGKYQLRWREQ